MRNAQFFLHLAIKHGYHSCYPFVIYLCYNNKCGIDNFVHSDHYKYKNNKNNRFALISDGYWDNSDVCSCNYIISELYCILGWISSASVCEHMIPQPNQFGCKIKKYNRIVLFEYDDKLNYFQQVINKFELIDDLEWTHVCWYLHDVLKVFDENKHIVFNYDDECWIIYVPIEIYKNYEKYQMNKFEFELKLKLKINENESFDQMIDQININNLNCLYRMTEKYILFFGQRLHNSNEKNNKYTNLALRNIDFSILNSLKQFDCVLNDSSSHRFLASKDSVLYEINYNDIKQK